MQGGWKIENAFELLDAPEEVRASDVLRTLRSISRPCPLPLSRSILDIRESSPELLGYVPGIQRTAPDPLTRGHDASNRTAHVEGMTRALRRRVLSGIQFFFDRGTGHIYLVQNVSGTNPSSSSSDTNVSAQAAGGGSALPPSSSPPPATGWVVPQLKQLLRVVGASAAAPVHNVTIAGVGFRDSVYTYVGLATAVGGGFSAGVGQARRAIPRPAPPAQRCPAWDRFERATITS